MLHFTIECNFGAPIFETYGMFDEVLPACEDYDLWLRICAHEETLVSSPQIYKYGGHADQLSHEFVAMDRFRVYALDKLIRNGNLNTEQETAARGDQKAIEGSLCRRSEAREH